jgi:hypothetical protein
MSPLLPPLYTPPLPFSPPTFQIKKNITSTEFVQKDSGGTEVVFLSMFSALIT